ncbi:MAG: inositol phosphate phosphatase SopB [Enterobacteriaceae bacterium]
MGTTPVTLAGKVLPEHSVKEVSTVSPVIYTKAIDAVLPELIPVADRDAPQTPVADKPVGVPVPDIMEKQLSSHSYLAVLQLQKQRTIAACTALEQLNLEECEAITQLRDKLEKIELEMEKEDRPATEREQRECANLNKVLTGILAGELEKIGIKPAKNAVKQAERAYNQANIEVLNGLQWQNITHQFQVNDRRYCSYTVPAAQMRLEGCDEAIFPHPYEGKGVSSSTSDESAHAINMWQTSLTEVDDSGNETPLFNGIRRGVLVAYSIKDKELRKQATQNALNELVLSALYSQPDKLQWALANPGNIVPLRIADISLLTLGIASRAEEKMVDEQMQAWKTLCQQPQPLTFKIRNTRGELQDIKINLQAIQFNVGVNEIALGLKSGNDKSDTLNKSAFDTLLGEGWKKSLSKDRPIGGWVGEYLTSHPDAKNAGYIKTLVNDIREIVKNKLHHADGGDPYKLAWRLSILTHEIGIVPSWGCKSGKDRTSMNTAEALAGVIAHHQEMAHPKLKGKISPEHQVALQQALLNCGNFEVQRYNTGVIGCKVLNKLAFKPLQLSYEQRIGDPEIWQQVAGLAKFYVGYRPTALK